MNRSDLAWALGAVLPHAGKTAQTAHVGLQHHQGALWAYATDRYTIGMARIADGTAPNAHLSTSEARDLLRFVKPTLRAHDSEQVVTRLRLRGTNASAEDRDELHVGIEGDSAVFDLLDGSPLSIEFLAATMALLGKVPAGGMGVYSPALFAKFSKAQRRDTDSLHLIPKQGRMSGAALVTVGDNFVGAIAGMVNRANPHDLLASVLPPAA